MNIIALCQGANFSVFSKIYDLTYQKINFNRIGIFVADAYYYNSNHDRTKLSDANCIYLKEWESVNAGLMKEPDYDLIKSRQSILGSPSLRNSFLADRRIFFGKFCKNTQSYKPRFNEKQMLGILSEAIIRVEKLFDEVNPDLILGFVPVTLHEYLILRYAESRNIRVQLLRSTKIDNYISFHDKLIGISSNIKKKIDFPPKYSQDINSVAENYLINTRERGAVYEGMHNSDYAFKKFQLSKFIPKLLSSLKNEYIRLKDNTLKNDNHNPGFLVPALIDNLLTPIRAKLARNFIQKHRKIRLNEFNSGYSFCLYPLHFEPEIALQIYGRPLQNQIETIRNIANSLPPGMILVVKEHPRSAGFRAVSYYQKISEIPNVIIEYAETPSINIVSKSKLVITVTGNIGLEAMVLKKPVIVLGETDYSVISDKMIVECKNLFKLSEKIQFILNNHKHDENALKNFISANISEGIGIDLYSFLLSKSGRVNFQENSGIELDKFRDYLVERLNHKGDDAKF